MKCYFCSKNLIDLHNSFYKKLFCNDCDCFMIYYYNNLMCVYLHCSGYIFYFHMLSNSCILYKKYKELFKFNFLPNINPQNAESKLISILAFM